MGTSCYGGSIKSAPMKRICKYCGKELKPPKVKFCSDSHATMSYRKINNYLLGGSIESERIIRSAAHHRRMKDPDKRKAHSEKTKKSYYANQEIELAKDSLGFSLGSRGSRQRFELHNGNRQLIIIQALIKRAERILNAY